MQDILYDLGIWFAKFTVIAVLTMLLVRQLARRQRQAALRARHGE